MNIKQTEEQIEIIRACRGGIREHTCGELGIERSVEAFIDAGKPRQLEDY